MLLRIVAAVAGYGIKKKIGDIGPIQAAASDDLEYAVYRQIRMSVRVLIAHLLLASPFRGISPHLSGALYRKRRKSPAFRHGDISRQ